MTIEQQLADVVRKQVSEELGKLVIPLLEKIAQATIERDIKTDSEIRVRQCDLPDYINVSVTKIKTLRKMPNAPQPDALGLFSVREWRDFIAQLPKIAA